ncbi:hypothetical protein H0248_05300 [Pectobacterium brasiliense]|uniref:hypothetical protein n=1 Tax=Pectobacterium brasiliense TaxID=180957 RepID=UPI0015DE6AFB|nr:hypothetical protein [Pectobacterium brasiliense]MBA0216788.1 hypothetical protein [Pectobacterium brasiliense]MBN3169168.1 hypothetical protein [Pectobacterium brasiliense]
MKNFSLLVSVIVFSFLFNAEVSARNTPCSKGKGGISHCTTDGQFVCNDGSISKSKKICSK